MPFRLPVPVRASQAVLFGPAALLALLGLGALHNCLARPVINAQDSPDGSREAVVYLRYSPLYPLGGEVEAHLSLRRLPGHEPLAERELGSHRWASDAAEAYRIIEWPDPGRLILRSADSTRSRLLVLAERHGPRSEEVR